MIKNNEIALVINTVEERRNAIADSRAIRTSSLLARVPTITTIAVLFSMIVGGIIYITQSQTAAVVAEQRSFNQTVVKTLERQTDKIERIDGEITNINSWRATIIPAPREARR